MFRYGIFIPLLQEAGQEIYRVVTYIVGREKAWLSSEGESDVGKVNRSVSSLFI